ncbi:MAG: NAD(P)H-hydrate dehydratase, partial [Psychrobacter sp.]|nr:NAD(P)H-hydrate dehydratase [Psychrobacter sp.]
QVINPSAWQVSQPLPMLPRQSNSHKGSFGHVLIIGGNQSQGSQGMGGAAIMASGSALVSGAGKLTAACHHDFHGALLTAQPNAMVVNINEVDSVKSLIKAADVIAIGMGLGRDTHSAHLFSSYLDFAIKEQKSLVIDADGLYHLANLQQANAELILQLKSHSKSHQVCFTPHSGEAAKLLDMEVNQVEADRLSAIRRCAEIYGGQWLLKGAGSLVLIDDICFVCRVGNAGMATAGMGDVLAGLVAGLIAQSDISDNMESLLQGVLIHGKAGDISMTKGKGLRNLQAFDMLPAIAQVISELT